LVVEYFAAASMIIESLDIITEMIC
jgi:hypothetical protein